MVRSRWRTGQIPWGTSECVSLWELTSLAGSSTIPGLLTESIGIGFDQPIVPFVFEDGALTVSGSTGSLSGLESTFIRNAQTGGESQFFEVTLSNLYQYSPDFSEAGPSPAWMGIDFALYNFLNRETRTGRGAYFWVGTYETELQIGLETFTRVGGDKFDVQVWNSDIPYTDMDDKTLRFESFADGRQVLSMNGVIMLDSVAVADIDPGAYQALTMSYFNQGTVGVSPSITSISGGCNTCERDWMGWAPPTVGAVDLNGGGYNLIATIDGYDAGSALPFPSFSGSFDDQCPGSLSIAYVSGLQAAMTAARSASEETWTALDVAQETFTQVVMTLGYNVTLIVNVSAGYENYGTLFSPDWDFWTQALAYLAFRETPFTPGSGAFFHILVNTGGLDTGRGVVVEIPDPGWVWIKHSYPGANFWGEYEYSHPATEPGGLILAPNFMDFFASGTEAITGTDYPLSIEQFFSHAGYFGGDWTVDAAIAQLTS